MKTRFTSLQGRTAGRAVLRQCALVALALLGAACLGDPVYRGTAVTPPRELPAFAFADSAGRPVSTAPSSGAVTLVFFGYTNCPDVCSTALSDWARVRKALGKDANKVRFLFVTVDPERDTPAVVSRFAAQFDSAFVGLSGSVSTVAAMQQAFGAASAKEHMMSDDSYLMGHSSQTFLLDDRGRHIVTYALGAGWDAIAADIRTVLD